MTDATDQALADFYARGGAVTRCPPAFAAVSQAARETAEAMTRAMAAEDPVVKAKETRKDAKGRRLNGWQQASYAGRPRVQPSDRDREAARLYEIGDLATLMDVAGYLGIGSRDCAKTRLIRCGTQIRPRGVVPVVKEKPETPVRRKHQAVRRRATEVERAVILLYENGMRPMQIEDETGVTVRRVNQILKSHAVPRRGDQGCVGDREIDPLIADFYAAGWSTLQCGAAFGVGKQRVVTAIRTSPHAMRKPWERTGKEGMTPPDLRARPVPSFQTPDPKDIPCF